MSLTRREQFAMAAMQGMLARSWADGSAEAANVAVKYADALIAELDKAKADEDGWINWNGGTHPVNGVVLVEVRFRDGDTSVGKAIAFVWSHSGDHSDIMAYRIVGDAA